MIAIMTVTGPDHPGIVAAVSTALAAMDVNILNISQTILGEYFTMILQCSFDESAHSIQQLQASLQPVAADQRVDIRLQSEAIFQAMHEL